jgi:hypothetical protein
MAGCVIGGEVRHRAPTTLWLVALEPPVLCRGLSLCAAAARRAYWGVATSSGNPRPRCAGSPFQPQPAAVIEAYVVDDRVSHDSYGLGRVVGLDASGATVDFIGKTVWIATPFHKMTKL